MNMELAEELEIRLPPQHLVESCFGVLVIALVIRPGVDGSRSRWNHVPHEISAIPGLPYQPYAGLKVGVEDDAPDLREQTSGQQ